MVDPLHRPDPAGFGGKERRYFWHGQKIMMHLPKDIDRRFCSRGKVYIIFISYLRGMTFQSIGIRGILKMPERDSSHRRLFAEIFTYSVQHKSA